MSGYRTIGPLVFTSGMTLIYFKARSNLATIRLYTGKGNNDGKNCSMWPRNWLICKLSKSKKVYEVPLTLAENDSDIKIKACTQKCLSHL